MSKMLLYGSKLKRRQSKAITFNNCTTQWEHSLWIDGLLPKLVQFT